MHRFMMPCPSATDSLGFFHAAARNRLTRPSSRPWPAPSSYCGGSHSASLRTCGSPRGLSLSTLEACSSVTTVPGFHVGRLSAMLACSSSRRSAYRLDAGVLQDLAHPIRELVVEPGELGGVLVAVLELVVVEELSPRLRARQFPEHLLPVRDVLLRNAGRPCHAAHLGHRGQVETRLFQRRHAGEPGQAPIAHLREHPDVAGANVLARLGRLDH